MIKCSRQRVTCKFLMRGFHQIKLRSQFADLSALMEIAKDILAFLAYSYRNKTGCFVIVWRAKPSFAKFLFWNCDQNNLVTIQTFNLLTVQKRRCNLLAKKWIN